MAGDPYRVAANPNGEQIKMDKKNVGRITAEVFYRDKDGLIVSRSLVFTGSYNGSSTYSDGDKRHSFTYADTGLHNFLGTYSDKTAGIYVFNDLIINKDRMIEIRLKVEEDIVEYPV